MKHMQTGAADEDALLSVLVCVCMPGSWSVGDLLPARRSVGHSIRQFYDNVRCTDQRHVIWKSGVDLAIWDD